MSLIRTREFPTKSEINYPHFSTISHNFLSLMTFYILDIVLSTSPFFPPHPLEIQKHPNYTAEDSINIYNKFILIRIILNWNKKIIFDSANVKLMNKKRSECQSYNFLLYYFSEIPGRWRRHCPNGPVMSGPGCNLVGDGTSDESGNAVASGKCVCGPSVPWCPGEPRPYVYMTRHECKLNLAAKIAYGREHINIVQKRTRRIGSP